MKQKKWCWLVREVKGGWKLRLCIGKHDFIPKPNDIFKTVKAVESFADSFIPSNGKIIFIHLKDSKFAVK